ncbi:MAG: PD-(D/E)XK nuclease family protein [Nanoarchaeota archaeon]|nr:PD-(D/E)XK nuclease family protein [Nanoarchaeota archaeon]
MQVNKKLWEQLGLTYKPADVKIDGRHVYTRQSDKMKLTGVTTIIDAKEKGFLKTWTVKEMYLFLTENWDLKKKYTKTSKDKLLLKGKGAWRIKKDKACDIGTILHKYLECYIQKIDFKETEEYKNSQKLDKKKKDFLNSSVKSFHKWEKEWDVQWLLSEEIIASKKHNVAGTLDALAIYGKDKKLALVDFKTSSRFSEDTGIQTAAYLGMLKAQMGITAEERIVVRLPKDSDDLEVALANTDLKFDQEVFLHLREVHRWIVNVKNNLSVKNEKGYKEYCPNIIYQSKK